MKNDLKELYDSLTNKELLVIMNEIKEAELTGSYPEDSAIRALSNKASQITKTDTASMLMLTQLNVFRQAAYRWAEGFIV
jgi:hypothetical protein